ncbi:response regulator transcription factor [Adlercreutzia equolifaciens]
MTWAHKARGSEAGEPDETGFPREGYALGDLAGAVSLSIPMEVYEAEARERTMANVSLFGALAAVIVAVAVAVNGALRRQGRQMEAMNDKLEEACALFQREWPDVVVLDAMMPKVDGFEVCRRIREVDENVPVLFLSARDGIIDKRIGFSFGGDDYLVKPFNEEELVMRIEALVRRSRRSRRDGEAAAPERPERFALGPFTFDEVRHEVLKGGEPVVLTPKEFQLLHHLASHPGAVMGKDELIEELWGEEYLDGAISIAVYVRKIREKIEENPAKPTYLKTVWGVGYSFEA